MPKSITKFSLIAISALVIATTFVAGNSEANAQNAEADQNAEGVVAANVNVQAQDILNNNNVCVISQDQSCSQ